MIVEACPHCGTRHVQTQVRFTEHTGPTGDFPQWRIVRCQNPNCFMLVLVAMADNKTVSGIHPVGSYELPSTDLISKEIREDYLEAGIALAAGCPKASMVMSRRVLQRCLKEQGCNQRNLVDAIDHAVNEGVLRRPFHSLATEIRQYGNLGAHPDDDQLQIANAENARQVLDFVRLLIHDFYEVPAAADNLRQQRNK